MGVDITTILNINQSLLYAWITESIKTSIYYRPQTKLREGNVFTPVCQSFCSRGGGGCMAGYVCGGGACMVGGGCMQ